MESVSALLHRPHSRILVIGLGYRTGLASANFLAARDMDVTVSDLKDSQSLAAITDRLDLSVKTVLGSQDASLLDRGFDLVVLSPGVPRTIPLVRAVYERGIPLIAEVELAWHFMKGNWIGITGTDGKSTTTALTDHILKGLNINSRAGGNIGIPLVSLVDDSRDHSVTVAELSSFQLEAIDEFTPDCAAFLNLAPDHLDRYDSMESYCDAKMRITKNMTAYQTLVYNLDDPVVSARARKANCSLRSFSLFNDSADCYFDGFRVLARKNGALHTVFTEEDVRLPGRHNVANAMASFLLVDSYLAQKSDELDVRDFAQILSTFRGLPHRLEYVDTVRTVRCINDSKATSVNAVRTAADSLTEPAVFIIGGRAKDEDYSLLADYLRDKASAVVLIGESTERFTDIFASFTTGSASSMKDAVERAVRLARTGGTVILSPGCASFDMYADYEERGRDYVSAVKMLKEEASDGS